MNRHANGSNGRPDAQLVALYARVSGDKQEKEQTIETQLFKLRERATADGLALQGEYLDNPYTGTVINRPALDRLMNDARKGLFGRVLIYAPDRLARGKPWMRGYLEEQLARAGVAVTYLTYEVEDSKEGRAMDGMHSVFAEWERETIVQRMKDGRQRRLNEGAIWRPVRTYGWSYTKPAPGSGERYGRLRIVDDEAAVIRQMFDWIIGGRTLHWVAQELNRRGVPAAKGGAWSPTQVGHCVHNPIHSGVVPTNRYVSVEPLDSSNPYRRHRKSSQIKRPREEWTTITREGIVTPEIQATAEAALKANMRLSKRNTKLQYLLSGLCYCGRTRDDLPGVACARLLVGDQRKPTWSRRYRCSRMYVTDTAHRCKTYVDAQMVEDAVWGKITALLQQPDVLLAQLAQVEEQDEVGRAALEDELTYAAKALESAQAALDKLTLRNATGAIDDDTFDRLQPDLIAARNDARERVRYARQELGAARADTTRWDDVRAYCGEVAAKLAELEDPARFEDRQALVRALVTRVVVYEDRLSIAGALPIVGDGDIGSAISWLRS